MFKEGAGVSLRSILVYLAPSTNAQGVLQVGIHLARRHDARLVGLQSVPEKTRTSPAGVSALEQAFREQAGKWQLSHEWCWASGDQQTGLVREARAHDLLVIGHAPPRGRRLWPQSNHLLESVLIKSGHPLIAVPHEGSFTRVGERVLVAWSGAREAARAVEGAMPILEKADQVTLVTADLRSGDALSIDHLVAVLERHEVNVAVRGARSLGRSIGEVLLSEAHALQCDLLVMGGYGHAPIREHLFGGVTYFVIEHATVPVLLSH